MLHKIAETGKTDDNLISVIISLNILVMHVTKIILFIRRQTRQADYYHICIISIGTGMLGTIFGIKIVMIRKNLSFH